LEERTEVVYQLSITWDQAVRLDDPDVGGRSRYVGGWSVSIDGYLWVGYEPSLLKALLLARRRYRRHRAEVDREHYSQL
jgi:hypothetical protein